MGAHKNIYRYFNIINVYYIYQTRDNKNRGSYCPLFLLFFLLSVLSVEKKNAVCQKTRKRVKNYSVWPSEGDDCRSPLIADVEFALPIFILLINVPFTSKPPLYLSQPLSRILSPRISRNLSKPGLPLSASNEKRSLRIDSAIYYHLISHPTRQSFVPADACDSLTVRQHLIVGGLTFFSIDNSELEVD